MSWGGAVILSGVQLVSDMALSAGLPVITGIAGYGAIGALIAYGMRSGAGGLLWAQVNARWNAIYTVLVPAVWLLRGKATYSATQWLGFILVAVGGWLVG